MRNNFFCLLFGAALVSACIATTAEQQDPQSQAVKIAGGAFQASGVVHIAGTNGVILLDDNRPSEVVWMEFVAGAQKQPAVPLPINTTVTDPEGITTDGTYVYVVGSLSQPHDEKGPGLIRFKFDKDTRQVGPIETVNGLKAFLEKEVPDAREGSLNIEGLAWDPSGKRLLIGLRSPIVEGHALIVPLQLRDPAAPLTAANIAVASDGVIRLPLGGAGIRSLEYDSKERRFWLITDNPTNQGNSDWRLVEWRPGSAPATRELNTFPRTLKPEGIARATLDGVDSVVVVFDAGYFQILR